MERRTTRARKERKKNRKTMVKSTGVGVAVLSLTISGFSQLSGTTYSAFNDQERLKGKAEACEIFPGVVENQFEKLITEMDGLASSLAPFFHYNSTSISFPGEPGDGKSLQSMKKRSDDLASRIHTYEAKLKRLQDQQQKYSDNEKEVIDNLQSITRLMQEIRANASFHPDCLDIEKGDLPKQLTQNLEEIEYLSEGTKKKVRDLFSLFPDSREAIVTRAADKNFTKEVEKGMSAVIDDLIRASSKVSSRLEPWRKEKQNVDAAIRKKEEEKREAEKAKQEAEEKKRQEQKAQEKKNEEKKKAKEKGSNSEKQKEMPSSSPKSDKKDTKDAISEPKPQKKEKTEQKSEKKDEKPQEQPSKVPEEKKKAPQPPEETEEKADEKQANPKNS